jgi:hypothetical protein
MDKPVSPHKSAIRPGALFSVLTVLTLREFVYHTQPADSHSVMKTGTDAFPDSTACTWLPRLLLTPLFITITDYAITRRHRNFHAGY